MLHVGQLVEYIGQDFGRPPHIFGYGDEILPARDTTYRIRDCIGTARGMGVRLFEIVNPVRRYEMGYIEPMFPAGQFRPLVETKSDISVFEKLQTPTRREIVDGLARDIVHDIRELVKGRG